MISRAIITNWWKNLENKEKRIIIGGGIVAIILLFYLLVLSPLTSAINSTRKKVRSQKDLATWMQHAVPRIIVLRKSGFQKRSIGKESLLAFIDNSSRKSNLHQFITQLEQSTDQKQVTIKFNQAPFDKLVDWLTSLLKGYGIKTKTASFYPTPKDGLTKTELTLQ